MAYYSSEIIYRYYKRLNTDDSEANCLLHNTDLKRAHKNELVLIELKPEEMLKCEENISTAEELNKWLDRKQLPVDGYSSPFTIEENKDKSLLLAMLKRIKIFKSVKRALSSLQSDDVPNGFSLLNEARKIFVPIEIKEEQNARYISDIGLPDYLLGLYGYQDEPIGIINGVNRQPTNNIAIASILSYIWADIIQKDDESLMEQYGTVSRAYHTKTRGLNSQVQIHWWTTPDGREIAYQLIRKRMQYIHKSCHHYFRKWADGNDEQGTDAGFYWQSTLQSREVKTVGPKWQSYNDLFWDIIRQGMEKSPEDFDLKMKEILSPAISDFLNIQLQGIKYQVDPVSKKRILIADSIVTGMYACLVDELQTGVKYRKCLLCDTYFVVDSKHPNRKYCDAHTGPRAAYYREKLNKAKKEPHVDSHSQPAESAEE